MFISYYLTSFEKRNNTTVIRGLIKTIHKCTHISKEACNKMITQLTGFLQLLNHNRTSPRLVKVQQRESEDHVRARTYTQTVCV